MRLSVVLLSLAFACFDFVAHTSAGEKSESKIKATASASKLGADGKQTVTITLDIEKGWYIYANPMKANTDAFDGNETRVAVKGKEKINASVKYPAGTPKKDGKYEYNIYEGRIVIQAELQRAAGDTGPLQISIDVNTCKKNVCLLPGTVTLKVP
jgi:DsbC/DsbD-like thiol-disulfide interchange protein